jgi:hypothetical protein
MTRLRPRPTLLALWLAAGLTAPAVARADDPLPVWPRPASQPDPAPPVPPEEACAGCERDRRACKKACEGPDGDRVPGDACLGECDKAYWRCVPPGAGCD